MTNAIYLVSIAIFGATLLLIISRLSKKLPRRLNNKYYTERWTELLGKVKTADGMVLSVIDGDKLLDEALKKRHFKGKTMGERLVSAQRSLSDNDAVWYAHKLRNRLVHEPNIRLKKREAQNALAGFKQALKDLGAL
ncbi:hypothetical protein H0X09_02970 [Candidatus Saccharibacteria bacterium]|nr:hypothetical protein [Candidatus Saccharibacteria bacterium]